MKPKTPEGSFSIGHPEKIQSGPEFLSAESYSGPKLRADLLFPNGKKYYITETKYDRPRERGIGERVLLFQNALIETQREKTADFEEVTPVVICRKSYLLFDIATPHG